MPQLEKAEQAQLDATDRQKQAEQQRLEQENIALERADAERKAKDEAEQKAKAEAEAKARAEIEQNRQKRIQAVIEAAKIGDLNTVQTLVEADPTVLNGQDTNRYNSLIGYEPRGNTPLRWAVQRNHPDVVKYLLSKGADSSITNNDGMSALTMAQAVGLTNVLALDKEEHRGTRSTYSLLLDAKLLTFVASKKLGQEYPNNPAGMYLVDFKIETFQNPKCVVWYDSNGRLAYLNLTRKADLSGISWEIRKELENYRLASAEQQCITFDPNDSALFAKVRKKYYELCASSATTASNGVEKSLGKFGDVPISFVPPDSLKMGGFSLKARDVDMVAEVLDNLPVLKEEILDQLNRDIADLKRSQ